MQITHSLPLLAMSCIALAAVQVRGDDTTGSPAAATSPQAAFPETGRAAIERGLKFLELDAAKWRKERDCSTCHHGTMTVWAFMEARSRGFAVEPETIGDTVRWTKDRLLERIDLPRDTRPGWSMVSTPALYLATMAWAVPGQDAVSSDELRRIGNHLLRHQEPSGAWSWASAPPKNRPPPFFESDEVATRLARLALAQHRAEDAAEKSALRDSRDRAAGWLKNEPPSDTTQAAALRLATSTREDGTADVIKTGVAELSDRQNPDGGWGQVKDRASDAYATGQALYVLNLAAVAAGSPSVQKGIAFLVATQNEDGSWPMKPRAHPDATPSNNTVPITYFGSAWGTLGLLRWSPATR